MSKFCAISGMVDFYQPNADIARSAMEARNFFENSLWFFPFCLPVSVRFECTSALPTELWRNMFTPFQMYFKWWLVRESNKRFALDGSHHRCSPLWAKNSPPDCFLNAQTLSGSIPKAESVSKPHQLITCFKQFGDSCGNRTRVAGVRGRSLNRLTNEPFLFKGLIDVSPLSFGAPSGARTRDTLIKSQVLYQLS